MKPPRSLPLPAAALLLAPLAATSAVRADDPPPPPAPTASDTAAPTSPPPTPQVGSNAQVSATAEALYEAGRDLLKAKKYAEACPKLAESLRIDPAVGTMLYLADCYEKNGQTASAWSMFTDAVAAAQQANQGERALKAKLRVQNLVPKLVRMSITLAPENQGVEGLEIKRDGLLVGAALLGAAVPVDPGNHTIDVTAPGKKPWSGTATVPTKAGSSISFVVPKLEDLPVLAPEPPPTPTVTATATVAPAPTPTVVVTAPPPPPPPPPPPDYTVRNVGLVVGGVGIAGVAVASALGLTAKAKNDEALQKYCDGGFCTDQAGIDLTTEAKTLSIGSTVAFIVSGAVLATGVGLVVYGSTAAQPGAPQATGRTTSRLPTSAPPRPRRPQVVLGPGSLTVRGNF